MARPTVDRSTEEYVDELPSKRAWPAPVGETAATPGTARTSASDIRAEAATLAACRRDVERRVRGVVQDCPERRLERRGQHAHADHEREADH